MGVGVVEEQCGNPEVRFNFVRLWRKDDLQCWTQDSVNSYRTMALCVERWVQLRCGVGDHGRAGGAMCGRMHNPNLCMYGYQVEG